MMDFDIEISNFPSAEAVLFGKQENNFLLFSVIE